MLKARTWRTWAPIGALCTAFAVVGAAGAASSPAASPSASLSSASPLTANLRVADHSPHQLHGVLFDASGSTGPISYYVFFYGDGVTEVTQQPLMMHGYRNVGTYQATVYVVDAAGGVASAAPVTINVRPGIPPVVAIASPRSGQRVVLGGGGFRLRGTASAPDGVRSVQLAIQLTSPAPHVKVPSGYCVWYDGKSYLAASVCSNPVFFTAHFAHGHWSFTIPGRALLPAGNYVVRVRGTDHAGNVSSFYAISLRTIIPFRLVRG